MKNINFISWQFLEDHEFSDEKLKIMIFFIKCNLTQFQSVIKITNDHKSTSFHWWTANTNIVIKTRCLRERERERARASDFVDKIGEQFPVSFSFFLSFVKLETLLTSV